MHVSITCICVNGTMFHYWNLSNVQNSLGWLHFPFVDAKDVTKCSIDFGTSEIWLQPSSFRLKKIQDLHCGPPFMSLCAGCHHGSVTLRKFPARSKFLTSLSGDQGGSGVPTLGRNEDIQPLWTRMNGPSRGWVGPSLVFLGWRTVKDSSIILWCKC